MQQTEPNRKEESLDEPRDTFRPTCWDDFIGQDALKRELRIRIAAARTEDRPLEHVLLKTYPGMGKTSLARVIAAELGDPFETRNMPVSPAKLAHLISDFSGVLLLDEAHRATPKEQEALLPLLSEGYMELGGYRYENQWLTIVAATTEPQKIIPPLADRFFIQPVFSEYSIDEMKEILRRQARIAQCLIQDAELEHLARASSGTPRLAKRLILAGRDLQVISNREPTAMEILELCGLDADGLTVDHLNYLECLDSRQGQAGLKTLCTTLRMNESSVTQLERLLEKLRLVMFSDRGRILTPNGIKKVKELRELAAA